mgnify:CR=1 FL=1
MNFINFFWPTEKNKGQPFIITDRAISIFILLFLLVKVIFSFEILMLRQTSLFAEVSAQKVLELTNDLRQQYGLPPLKENSLLVQAAQEKAQDMIRNKYFAHFSPTGISPWYFIEKSGYNYHYAGENLAMNFLDSEEVVRAWLNSPTHRDNLLNQKYKEIGVAVVDDDITGDNLSKIVVVQMFGSPIEKSSTLTKVAQAEEKPEEIPTTTAVPATTTTVLKQTTTTFILETIPQITQKETKVAQVEGEEVPPTSTTLLSPETTVLSPVVNRVEENNETFLKELTQEKSNRDKIQFVNQIIAFILISLGTVALIGIIVNQQKGIVPIVTSELILRGALIILIGFAFLLFKMEIFIGSLAIA